MSEKKVGIIGAGAVGSTIAYTMMLQAIADSIVMIDIDKTRLAGEVMDLNHCLPYVHETKVRAGDYADLHDANLTIVTAGIAKLNGGTRLDLLEKNAKILKEIINNITKVNKNGVILIVSNPVDILTKLAIDWADMPEGRVFGSGTVLDSARFRYMLSRHCGVSVQSTHAMIIGEHGDSEVAAYSAANIGGIPLKMYCSACDKPCPISVKDNITKEVRTAAYKIIEGKGSTYYGVATSVCRISNAILRDEHAVMTVSTNTKGRYGLPDVCLSLPSLVGIKGITKNFEPPLSNLELSELRQSANILYNNYNSLQNK